MFTSTGTYEDNGQIAKMTLNSSQYSKKSVETANLSFKFRINSMSSATGWVGFSLDKNVTNPRLNCQGLNILCYNGYSAEIRNVLGNYTAAAA